jgi:hypothetical protein
VRKEKLGQPVSVCIKLCTHGFIRDQSSETSLDLQQRLFIQE